MKETIENLFPMNRTLLGEGFDNALAYLNHLIPLEILEVPSGTQFGTWTVPDEWIVRDAWVKDPEGNKIIDYKKNPLSLVVGSRPIHGTVNLDELRQHWHYSDEIPDSVPYVMKFYDKDWGFCVAKNQVKEKNTEVLAGVNLQDGTEFVPEWKDTLPEGQYEVFIDTEYRPGTMKIGVHTLKGESDREILLFAHLDHPYQANDNLSGVACLVNLYENIHAAKHGFYGGHSESAKIQFKHTIKLIFCAETIGSIAYANVADISKVDFAIAVDICGNDNTVLFQKSYDPEDKINRVTHVALMSLMESYRKGIFRKTIGSDEYVFNDPKIGIPGIMLSTWPYPEYHTADDTPDKIDYERIKKMSVLIQEIIRIWEQDFIPIRNFTGPLMRSKYGIQTENKAFNMSWDYFIYSMDGKKSLAELCCEYDLNWDYVYEKLSLMEKDGQINRGADAGQVRQQKTSKQKHKRV